MENNEYYQKIIKADLNFCKMEKSNIPLDLPKYTFDSKSKFILGKGRDSYVIRLNGNSKGLVAKVPEGNTKFRRIIQWGEIFKNYEALVKAYKTGFKVVKPLGFAKIRDVSSEKEFCGFIMENAGNKNILEISPEKRKPLELMFNTQLEKMRKLFPGKRLDFNYKNGVIGRNKEMKICEILY